MLGESMTKIIRALGVDEHDLHAVVVFLVGLLHVAGRVEGQAVGSQWLFHPDFPQSGEHFGHNSKD